MIRPSRSNRSYSLAGGPGAFRARHRRATLRRVSVPAVGDDGADVDVLVIGAGPTGLTLATELHAHGARVRVVDRLPDRVHESRALAVQPRTLEVLARRVSRKDSRPLLRDKDPIDVLRQLAEVRYPLYAEADIVVETADTPHQVAVDQVLAALAAHKANA